MVTGSVLNTQKKHKLEPISESAEKNSDVAGSQNTVPEVSPFAKPLSIPGIHFGSATNFTINLNFGQQGSSNLFLIAVTLCTIGLAWFHEV